MKLPVNYNYETGCYLLLWNYLLLTIIKFPVTIMEVVVTYYYEIGCYFTIIKLEVLEGGATHLLTKSKQQQNDHHNLSK